MTSDMEGGLSRLSEALARAEAAAEAMAKKHRNLLNETQAALDEIDTLIAELQAPADIGEPRNG